MQSPFQSARPWAASLQPHTLLVAFCSWDLGPLPFCKSKRRVWAHKSIFQLYGSSVCPPQGPLSCYQRAGESQTSEWF